jgi:hypothetical protein
MSLQGGSRYGSQYGRVCARAGCNAPAVATLRFQSTERRAWLAELDDSAARTQGDLCQRHAAALVLPRGWELHDERASAVAPPAPEPVELDASDEPDVGEAVDGDDEAAANGAGPRSAPAQFGSNDDDAVVEEQLDTILDARTPLLQRAFRNARPN